VKLNLEQVRETLQKELPALRRRFLVKSLAIFGSVARQDPQPNDLDLLVEFYDVPGMFGFIALENHLSDMMGLKVDLLVRDSLKPRVSKSAIKELVLV